MTPQLQQAIKLLQLSRLELLDSITQELEENPVLEEQAVSPAEDDTKTEGEKDEQEEDVPDLPEVTIEEHVRDDVDWESYLSEYNTSWAETSYEPKDTPSFESTTSSKTNLYSHLICCTPTSFGN
jgi:RNA polymerase sigma-54 factor